MATETTTPSSLHLSPLVVQPNVTPSPIESEFSNYIDLDKYNDEDEDLKILCFTPISLENGQSSSSSSTRRTFDCEICVERKPKIESFRINGCSHSYCNDCVSKYIADESGEKINESECPHCHRMMCVECGTKWHPGIACEEFQKLAENERGRDDILLKKMAEDQNWRRCPSCKFYIELIEGCSTMMCRCGLEFCYECGTPADDHSHYCENFH
ncbi:PREDICTED: E3 ubiquitin-protein ligase RNF19B-like [Camelina sativa]|uniref:RBR-type E3 ubiquitin transferase n=1 Tax=Camelina sativa TaxID=90675 RepID=A0ABM1Q9S9_CAMSA|nr:PREDICTED: E3 ubiquitin-protein ligase RNF19B-like [Camelina sativa]